MWPLVQFRGTLNERRFKLFCSVCACVSVSAFFGGKASKISCACVCISRMLLFDILSDIFRANQCRENMTEVRDQISHLLCVLMSFVSFFALSPCGPCGKLGVCCPRQL